MQSKGQTFLLALLLITCLAQDNQQSKLSKQSFVQIKNPTFGHILTQAIQVEESGTTDAEVEASGAISVEADQSQSFDTTTDVTQDTADVQPVDTTDAAVEATEGTTDVNEEYLTAQDLDDALSSEPTTQEDQSGAAETETAENADDYEVQDTTDVEQTGNTNDMYAEDVYMDESELYDLEVQVDQETTQEQDTADVTSDEQQDNQNQNNEQTVPCEGCEEYHNELCCPDPILEMQLNHNTYYTDEIDNSDVPHTADNLQNVHFKQCNVRLEKTDLTLTSTKFKTDKFSMAIHFSVRERPVVGIYELMELPHGRVLLDVLNAETESQVYYEENGVQNPLTETDIKLIDQEEPLWHWVVLTHIEDTIVSYMNQGPEAKEIDMDKAVTAKDTIILRGETISTGFYGLQF